MLKLLYLARSIFRSAKNGEGARRFRDEAFVIVDLTFCEAEPSALSDNFRLARKISRGNKMQI